MTPVLPFFGTLPLPAPVWLLKALLLLTFIVHLLFMNLMAGGNLLAALFAFKGKPRHLDAARGLVRIMPYATAFAIVFGVAPLLFIQVLYGPLFYTSAILIGTPFLLSIPVIILAYALMYLVRYRWDKLKRSRPWLPLLNFLLLGYVGFIMTSLSTLMLDPDRFKNMYLAHPGGWQLNMAEPTLIPRFLHMMVGAIAVAGLYVAIRGARRLRLEPEQGRWQYRSGATWFAGATLVNMALGVWWLLALPKEQMMTLMGGSLPASIAFGVALAAALLALCGALLGINSVKPGPYLWGTAGALVAVFAGMAIMRDAIRGAALRPDYVVQALPVGSQWGAIGLFALLMGAGAWVCWWLLKQQKIAGSERRPKPPSPGLTDSGIRSLHPGDSRTTIPAVTDSGAHRLPPSSSGPHRLVDE